MDLEREYAAADRDAETGCWTWTGSTRQGYGQLRVGHRVKYAHRMAYEAHVGPIPEGLVLDHLCRNRACVNPDHLEPVTNRENILRGVSPAARAAGKTHCVHGHEYTEANTMLKARGRRGCRACHYAQRRARDRARREREVGP